ncbi:MAG: ArsR/SmtB family transcription factor [Actinocrinis sp.]
MSAAGPRSEGEGGRESDGEGEGARMHTGERGEAEAEAGGADVDRVFTALSDPTRRLVLEVLGRLRQSSASAIARETPVSRQAVVKHLAVLEEAGLVAGRRVGREVLFRVRPEGLRAAASWMTDLAAVWDRRLHWLKEAAEAAEIAAPPPGPQARDTVDSPN